MNRVSRRKRKLPAGLLLAVVLGAANAHAQQLEPVRYTVSFPAPHTHYVEIEAVFPVDGTERLELMMPVWTPGSYMVREYSRNVESLVARDSDHTSLQVEKTRKNRWRVASKGARSVSVHYRLYAHEMSVRTNWVDEEYALLNGAPTFITLVENRRRPHEVRLLLPPGWSTSLSGMPSAGAPSSYRAPDYDTLVDSPIVAGNPAVYEFSGGGVQHFLVDIGERGIFRGPQAVQDLRKIVQTNISLWRTAPYDKYYFFNIIGAASVSAGLEHRNSTVIVTQRDATEHRDLYLRWLTDASHEHFHSWNVKRLRPQELGPFDYENEVYTKSLWFAEGVTDYFATLNVHRAGVSTREEFLQDLSDVIRSVQTTPGRLAQSAEMASYDAWIKYYRPDENSANSAISYYDKGAVIGFLLDARIRRATGGKQSLDDLMRVMFQRFSEAKGFSPEDLRAAAAEIVGAASGKQMRAWLSEVLETTNELDYSEALEFFGLQFAPPPAKPRAWLGVVLTNDGKQTTISEVRRGSPAFVAGLAVDDQIVAVNQGTAQIPPDKLSAQLRELPPGTKITIIVNRAGTVRPVEVTLAPDPAQNWELALRPGISAAQTRSLVSWLGK